MCSPGNVELEGHHSCLKPEVTWECRCRFLHGQEESVKDRPKRWREMRQRCEKSRRKPLDSRGKDGNIPVPIGPQEARLPNLGSARYLCILCTLLFLELDSVGSCFWSVKESDKDKALFLPGPQMAALLMKSVIGCAWCCPVVTAPEQHPGP